MQADAWPDDITAKRFTVDLCACQHPFRKPTDLWTNLDWAPQGTMGDGRCHQRCGQGSHTNSGTFKHNFALGQEDCRKPKGRGA